MFGNKVCFWGKSLSCFLLTESPGVATKDKIKARVQTVAQPAMSLQSFGSRFGHLTMFFLCQAVLIALW